MIGSAQETSPAGMAPAESLRRHGRSTTARRRRVSARVRVALVSLVLCLLLVAMAIVIVLAQSQTRARTRSTFQLRAQSSAMFISAFASRRHGRARIGDGGFPASALQAFVDHAVPYREHEVYLVDGEGRLLAASPRTRAATLQIADPRLAGAAARAADGTLDGARTASTFAAARVHGSSWRLVIAVPDDRLYASIGGWAERVPWIVFALVSLFGVSLVALFSRSLADHSRLAALSRELEKAAHTDHLTGLLNRRALSERLLHATAQARRQGEPLSVLMIDLDRFKQINDRFGHEAGDRVLAAVGRLLTGVFRASDVYGRWGGDEFVVGLLDTDEHGARAAAGRLLEAARALALGDERLGEGVRLSVGGATGVYTTLDQLIQRADAALYESKAGGRERITIASQSDPIVCQSDRDGWRSAC